MKKDSYETIAAIAEKVKGFLAADEGRALYDIAMEAAALGPCLEIGSFCGKSAVYIGSACRERGVTLFTIDHHRGSEEQQPGQLYFDPDIYDEKSGEINSLPLLRNTLRMAGLEDTVIPMITGSGVAARNWATPLGMVFIDGGHSYESALSDYQNWGPHLLGGGFLVFHDIYTDPSKGGQAPRQVYTKALDSGDFDGLPMVNTLGILRKRHAVVVEKKVCC
jgi:MMP 1-O-methyltransferase